MLENLQLLISSTNQFLDHFLYKDFSADFLYPFKDNDVYKGKI